MIIDPTFFIKQGENRPFFAFHRLAQIAKLQYVTFDVMLYDA